MKKCKSCQTEIDQKAKKCPNCKADQRNWFVRHKITTAILVLIVIGILASAGGKKPGTTNSPAKAPQTAMVVDVKAFGDEFDANQVAAEKKYKDKLVQLTASISNITDSGVSFYNVSSKQFSTTQISCNVSNKDDLLSLKNGQSVTVKGTVGGQTIGVISLNNCEIVK